ncbi:MAG: glycosyltransferase 87 family protein [Candidatus Dormibacteria bacterium]
MIEALFVLVAFRVLVLVVGVQQTISDDGARFYAVGHAPGVPYRDYSVEYPPILVALVKLLAFATPNQHAFTAVIVVLSIVAEAAIAVLLWRTWSVPAALWFIAADTLLLSLFVARLDLIGVALVVAAVSAALRGRAVTAALCFVIAVGLKLWPLPLALMIIPALPAASRRAYIVTGTTAFAALMAAWLALGGFAGIEQVLTFRGATGWQIESVVGSVVRVITGEPAILQAGADRFGHVPAALPAVMQLLAAAVAVWTLGQVRGRRDIGAAWVACVGAFLLASALLSPQFIAWLIPAGAIAFASGDYLVAVAVAGVVLGTLLENAEYARLVANLPDAVIYLMLRNAALLVAVVVSVRALRHRRSAVAETLEARRTEYSGAIARLSGPTERSHADTAA